MKTAIIVLSVILAVLIIIAGILYFTDILPDEPAAEPLPSAEHPEGLACPACNVVYPVRDDIPIMLVDAAVERARWDEKHKG